jgi:hypothetical protein
MAYSKNERKLKAFLSKQDDTRKPSPKIKNNPRRSSDDSDVRRG